MPATRHRPTNSSAVKRRRDVEPEETEDAEDDEVEVDARTIRRPARPTHKTEVVSRRRPVDEDSDDDDDLDEDDEDDEDDDDDDVEDDVEEVRPAPKPRNRPARPARKDDEEDEEDEPAPKPASKTRSKLPPGIRTGRVGADAVIKETSGSASRLKVDDNYTLIKFLEDEPFVSWGQHWVPSPEKNQGDRPYTCIGRGCPLCELSVRVSGVIAYNVAVISEDGVENKVLQLSKKADKALTDAATNRKTSAVDIEYGFFTVSRSGSGQQAQTNFHLIKERDLEEDWGDLLEELPLEEINEMIEESRDNLFTPSIVEVKSMKELRDVARFLAED